jgi:hypothetical protein
LIWSALFELYQYEEYKLKIETIIKEYGHFNRDKIEKELVEFDCPYIIRFFSNLLSPCRLSHCIIAKTVVDQCKRVGIDVQPHLYDYLNGPDFLIYKVLKGERHLEEFDWRKEKELKESDIRELFRDATQETIQCILRICAIYEKNDPKNTWDIGGGLHYAFDYLAINKLNFRSMKLANKP